MVATAKVGKDTQQVEAAVSAVRDGKVHVAGEISDGEISQLSVKGYGAKPVFMGPSSKKGGWRDWSSNHGEVTDEDPDAFLVTATFGLGAAETGARNAAGR
jgi:hypothetical protein